MDRLVRYFTQGTEGTCSGGKVGLEIESDFLDFQGRPISKEVSLRLLNTQPPAGYSLKLELGRQKLELNVNPKSTFEELWQSTRDGLSWLYQAAAELGAYPFFGPEISCEDNLLLIQEKRDELWIGIDGQEALEHLCRCSSIQFTVDVHPADAIDWINRLYQADVERMDYSANDRKMSTYIRTSKAAYREDRYGGPQRFESIEHYAFELSQHHVVMHKGTPCWLPIDSVDDLDIDLFLRSVWWHFRLRRYGDSLALEMRPFSRRTDNDIVRKWEDVKRILGL